MRNSLLAFKQIIIPKYPTALDFNDAIQNQGFENVYNTLGTPMPPASSSVKGMGDLGFTEEQIKPSYPQGDGYLNPDVKDWWQEQKEKPRIRDIEKYYESPGTTPFQISHRRKSFDDALKVLGITEEEARQKYSVE